jgi:hypothetical protein
LTGAPPAAIRPQPNMDLTLDMVQDKALPQQRSDVVQAQASRTHSTAHRPHDDHARSINPVLQNSTKVPPKRPLPQDAMDESHSRPTTQRNPQAYNNDGHQPKRRRTSEIIDSHGDNLTDPQPKMTAPPIRQSTVRQKVRGSHFKYAIKHVSTNSLRMCRQNQFSPAGTPMRHWQPTFNGRLSLLSTTSLRQLIQWIWPKSPKRQFLLP